MDRELTAIPGIGEKMASRLMKVFGSYKDILDAAERLEVERFADIEGIGQARAINLVRSIIGDESHNFLKTERSEAIYRDIIELLRSYANTSYAKNKLSLLSPLPQSRRDEMEERMDFVLRAKNEAEKLDREEVSNLLRKLHRAREPRTVRAPGRLIVVENDEQYTRLREEGITKFCEVATPDYAMGLGDYDLVVYAYDRGDLDVSGLDNIAMVPAGCREYEIVPEIVLSFFASNISLLETLSRISALLGIDSVAAQILQKLEGLKKDELNTAALEQEVGLITEALNRRIQERMQNVQISGGDVLQVMGQGMPRAVKEIYDNVISEGALELKKLGLSVSIEPTYPLRIDDEELERSMKSLVANRSREYFELSVRAARELEPLRAKIEEEIDDLLEFDYLFALGCFALDYDLRKPIIGKSYDFSSCIHLNIAKKRDAVRIDYNFGSPENVVLLTGANSGGKTTLLETITQTVVMTHMGLPVCASSAKVELVDELYFFAHKRSLSAGAFETFLRSFMPVVASGNKKLVLADELEAMTELEAASKIIATFIEYLKNTDSKGVIVTHMAGDIKKFVDVRIDGIDAGGLDENYNLVVDRTPKIGHHARSTPELIVKKLEKTSDGAHRAIYSKILEKFS